MDKLKRLKEVLSYINEHDDKEYHFDKLYDKIKEEYDLEYGRDNN